jgi:hypothetical protein
MSMSNYCKNLDINLKVLKQHLHPFKSFLPFYHVTLDAKETLDEEIFDFLSDVDVKIIDLTSFYCKPHEYSIIHIDAGNYDYAKMNFIYGGKNSLMNWFSPKVPHRTGNEPIAATGDFHWWMPDEVELIHQEEIGFPGICRVGIPHNVKNFEEPRRCISVHLADAKTGERLMWEDALLRFAPWFTNKI